MVEVISWNKKFGIMRSAKNLKGQNIWITEDYTKKLQEQRKILIQHMKIAREEGPSMI